jgi:hypothetical protein
MTDIALFEPEDVPDALSGADAAFLADLHDLAAKYGTDVQGVEGLRRVALDVGAKTVFVSVCVEPSPYRSILVSPWTGGGSVTASHKMLMRRTASFVLWDRSIALADVRAGMIALDAEMAAAREPLTGARLRMVSDRGANAKLRVDQIFAERGKAIGSYHGDDPEAFRLQFDRPDDVAVVTAPDGRKMLCHRRDARGFAPGAQEAAILRAIERRGLKTEADLRKLSETQLREMHDEIKADLFGDKD